MTKNGTYDLAVIGAGPAGYVGAIRAAQLGLSACVIERGRPGGVCLNIGCIPSKALIHQAKLFRSIDELAEIGVTADPSGLDYGKVFAASRKAADTLSKGVAFLLKKNKIDLIAGRAVLSGANRITIEGGATVSAKHVLIATGSRPIELPPFPFDGRMVLSSDDALMLDTLPRTLVILGGGYIGCEFAYIMNAFGVTVTVVEMMDQILPMEDEETAAVLARALKKRGVDIRTTTKALSLEKHDAGIRLSVEGKDGKKDTITGDKLLVVVGRRPNTEGIGLESAGIRTEKGFIPVGDHYRTTAGTVYAAGDVVASPLLAHVASKEAEIAVEHMAGRAHATRIDPDAIPAAVYTEPQVASFGLNEKRARERGLKFRAASFPYRGAGKSVAIGRPEGIVKIVYDPELGEILGAQAVGAEATEIIHELLLAKAGELLTEDVARMIHAHPTLSEAVMEAARAAGGWAIHA